MKYLCILQCHEYDGSLESPWDSFDVLPDLAASCYGLEKLSIRLKNFLDSKDQLISECLFDVLNLPQKITKKFEKFLPKNLKSGHTILMKALYYTLNSTYDHRIK